MAKDNIILGDCFDVFSKINCLNADLIYFDPPFFTQKEHSLSTRDGEQKFSFTDNWLSNSAYASYMYERIKLMYSHLSDSGSIFIHCDTNANYIFRCILDDIFGKKNFRSEIVWAYKRWSNSSQRLLPNHQYILYYTKTNTYTFKKIHSEYAPTTNLDQILQKRSRDIRNKAVYAKDEDGNIILDKSKKGVPLSDVWSIPFLNPKAAERVGYPTQKPILLMEQILNIASNKDDLVVDPFCGSGSMLVAAKLMGRRYFGIDKSEEAINITTSRLKEPKKTSSALMERGYGYYENTDDTIREKLIGVECNFVQRNKGIDAILKKQINKKNVFIRIQRQGENLQSAVNAIEKATKTKGDSINIVVLTNNTNRTLFKPQTSSSTYIIEDIPIAITKLFNSHNC